MLSASHVCTVILQIHELEKIVYKMFIAGAMLQVVLSFQSGCRKTFEMPMGASPLRHGNARCLLWEKVFWPVQSTSNSHPFRSVRASPSGLHHCAQWAHMVLQESRILCRYFCSHPCHSLSRRHCGCEATHHSKTPQRDHFDSVRLQVAVPCAKSARLRAMIGWCIHGQGEVVPTWHRQPGSWRHWQQL